MSTRPQIGLRMHGVHLNLSCDHEPQLEYIAALLGNHVCVPWERADVEVHSTWHTASTDDDARAPLFDVAGLDAYGNRVHLGDGVLVWTDTFRDKDLQLRFRRDGSVLRCDVAYRFRPSSKKDAKHGNFQRKKFFDLARYLVFFPVAWYLRRTRGWELLHASAVASDAGAIVIAGAGGAGKTTTGIALVARAGMTLLTENLLFCDGRHVYPLSEPIRLTAESLALLGESAQALRRYELPSGLKHKAMFVPPVEPDPPGVPAALVFLARFSSPGFARPIPPAVARELIRATNVLTLELNDFYWYASALDLLWPPVGKAARARPIHRLTASTPCYELGIDRALGVEPVVERILGCLHPAEARSAPEHEALDAIPAPPVSSTTPDGVATTR